MSCICDNINIKKLDIIEEIKIGDFIIIETPAAGTSILDFKDFVIGKDNISFADEIESNTSNINALSGSIDSLNTTLTAASALWESAKTTVQENSASWLGTSGGTGTGQTGIFIAHETRPPGQKGNDSTTEWSTRTFDTSYSNIEGASLANNKFYLPSGTYEVYITCPAVLCLGNKAKLIGITPYGTSQTELIGSTGYQTAHSKGYYKQGPSTIAGLITISSAQAAAGCYVQHIAESARDGGYGFVHIEIDNTKEVYGQATFRKIG